MKLITIALKIILIIALHLILFICYPETGEYGNYYFWISIFLWTTVMISISSNIKYLKIIAFPVKIWINLTLYLIMSFFITITMPQRDGINVFKKIRTGKFPAKQDIETGKIKYLNTILFKNPNENLQKTFTKIRKATKILGREE